MYIEELKINAFMEYEIQNDDRRKKPTTRRDLVACVSFDGCGIDIENISAIVNSIEAAFPYDPVKIETSFTTRNT